MTEGARGRTQTSRGDWEGQVVCSACGEEITEAVKQQRYNGGVCPHCGDVETWGTAAYRIKARRQVFARMGPEFDWEMKWEYKEKQG